ncbi:AI-2E family transporter [Tumebacillus sp. ITR2]|uniref:AI-2E family transporter n=1 Tax=Tumebacillus amylolyticus TaxID=2801339 RepID=A0ABS1JAQ4_9BACL|nr:AI-2E family transporter [Tumebacillus amylolyticus]MBL0387362.1 AI-2E family transporter [Tumebacillus amylolyticus]
MLDLKRGRTLYLALVTLVILACVWLLWEMREVLKLLGSILGSVLAPFLISVIIAYLLNPLVHLLQRRGMPRGMSIVVIYIVFFLFASAALVNMIPMFIDQLRELGEKLPALIKQVEGWMNDFHENKRFLPLAVRNAVDSNLGALEVKATASISHILEQAGVAVEGMAGAFVVPFLVFYMLKDVKGIERAVIAFFPKGNRQEVIRLIRSVDEALGNYIRGQLLVALLVGVLAYVGYLIIHMPYGFLLALIVSITNIIPYVGPFIGAAPAILLGFTVSPMMALKVLILNVIIQQLEGNVISPLLIGRSLKLHPMLIIFALLLGGEMFGMLGLILCIPVVAVGKVILQHLVLHYMKR